MNKKIFIQIIIICFLFGFIAFMGYRHYTRHTGAVEEVRKEMGNALEDLRKKNYPDLAQRIIKLENLSKNILDPIDRQKLKESCALLAMIHAALTGNDLEAVKLFSERCKANPGRKIQLLYFEELLPYAKFHVLNVFLKRYDLKTAHLFTHIYPKVLSGPHAPFFKALDTFVSGDIPGAVKQFELLLAKDPENRMFKNTLSYIRRVEKKKLLAPRKEEKK